MNKKTYKLSENRVWRIYLGGKLLDEFRGSEGTDGYFPEDWLASVVPANNPPRPDTPEREGLSKTCDGEYLKDIIDADPSGCLGKEHIEKHGENFGVLTKFLDSAERLPIQVHPDKHAAKTLFNSEYGKTEAWYILDSRKINGEDPYILLGFKEDVTAAQLKELFDKQDIPAMAELMHKIPVKSGDVFLITGGTPHAIGPGCFLLEIQEPTDYTISLEKCNTLGEKLPDFLCHMGIGFDKMFDCFNYINYSLEELLKNFNLSPKTIEDNENFSLTRLIGYEATPCFSLRRLDVKKSFTRKNENAPSALVCISGEGKINSTPIKKGESLFVRADALTTEFEVEDGYEFTVLECLPPC
ncbi:MAG: class I mannose-6-phosphate isomerase [Clostridia bacterium]|nr:class I mannose-6-phosphate isomerase [Clostridia bacterium]